MPISSNNIVTWLKGHYDKIIAFLVLFFLLGSLIHLAVRIGAMHSDKQKFEQEIGSYKPKHPDVNPVDTKIFSDVMDGIENPVQLSCSGWTNKMMFVPDRRVWCVDCKKPIPFSIAKCSFCGAVNPDPANDPLRDADKDGLLDEWEKKHGLSSADPSDAEKDLDGDGFSNIEEFMSKPSTDPADAKSHPSITAKLRLLAVTRDPFKLKFRSVMKNPDESLNFGLNLNTNNVTRTHFAKLGQDIKGEGFKLVKYEPKMEKKNIPGVGIREVDVSILTLQRGDKLIPLVKDRDVAWDEFTAKLLFTVNESNIVVKVGNILDLKNEKFEVKKIDSEKESILLKDANGDQEFSIEKFPEPKKDVAGEAKSEGNVKPAEK